MKRNFWNPIDYANNVLFKYVFNNPFLYSIYLSSWCLITAGTPSDEMALYVTCILLGLYFLSILFNLFGCVLVYPYMDPYFFLFKLPVLHMWTLKMPITEILFCFNAEKLTNKMCTHVHQPASGQCEVSANVEVRVWVQQVQEVSQLGRQTIME